MRTWRHLLAPDLAILFVGFNPSLWSAAEGHFYAHPGNAFWRLLAESGLVPVPVGAADDARLLDFGFGFMDLSDRPTASSGELSRSELAQGWRRLRFFVSALKPRWVAFTGKGVFAACPEWRGRVPYGEVPSPFPPPTKAFVLPSPSGRSGIPYAEKLRLYRALASRVALQAPSPVPHGGEEPWRNSPR